MPGPDPESWLTLFLATNIVIADMIGAGVFKLAGRNNAAPPSILTTGAALVVATVSVTILVLAYFERPLESSFALIMLGVGIAAYFAFAATAPSRAATSGGSKE